MWILEWYKNGMILWKKVEIRKTKDKIKARSNHEHQSLRYRNVESGKFKPMKCWGNFSVFQQDFWAEKLHQQWIGLSWGPDTRVKAVQ